MSKLSDLFDDQILVEKIKKRLPYLFQIAELESSRAGRIGMVVGSLREQILIALLVYKFGVKNVDTNIPINEAEIDVKLFGYPISIKTITGSAGIKIAWTVDAQKAQEFSQKYVPKSDILLAQIRWDNIGNLFYIPLEVQLRVFKEIGRNRYIKLPKVGTNPRGIEISKEAFHKLVRESSTKSISIYWQRSRIDYKPYERWINYWSKEL